VRQFWVHKGTSNFCNELDYDIEAEKFVKCRPDEFYDIVSTKDTIQGGIHVIEYESYKQLEEQLQILKSRASQFESTLKETMGEREKLNEKLKIATEALEEIGSDYYHKCFCCDGGASKYDVAREALDKLKKGLEA